jgi:hypothetical protein
MLSVAPLAPDELGLNAMLIAQLPAAATLAPHELLAIAKSPAFVPDKPTLPSAAADAVVLLTITV